MIELVTFHVKHLEQLSDRKEIFKHDPRLDNNIAAVAKLPSAFVHTLMRDDVVLGVVGGHLIWNGVVEIWSVLSVKVLETPIAFHRKIKDILDFYQEAIPLHRMHAFVQADFTQGQRWLEMLGFECEGLVKKYGADKSDHFIFARTE